VFFVGSTELNHEKRRKTNRQPTPLAQPACQPFHRYLRFITVTGRIWAVRDQSASDCFITFPTPAFPLYALNMNDYPSAPNGTGFLIHDISRLLRQRMDEFAAKLGLTLNLSRTLAHIAHRPGLRPADLAEIMEISPIVITRQIERLERMGLVSHEADPNDRRAKRMSLTAAAEPLLKSLDETVKQVWAQALHGVPEQDYQHLRHVLEQLKHNLLERPADEKPKAAE
jgi:DNA-binding MarR family transcriptional regulator